MSIEKDLGRIATALEGILAKLDHIGTAVSQEQADTIVEAPKEAPKQTPPSPAPAADGPSTQATTAPAAEVPPPPPVEQATVAPTTSSETVIPAAPAQDTPPPVVSMTADELNTALVAVFKRLGKRDPIDAVLREFGVQSITDLKEDQYAAVINKVKAIAA